MKTTLPLPADASASVKEPPTRSRAPLPNAVQTPTVEPALRRIAILMTDREQAAVDPWLVAPDTAHKRVADRRRQSMRLSALFEEFTEYLRVEREATPRTIATYRWCFHDYLAFARQEVGGTVLATQFTAEGCRAYQYSLSARSLQTNTIRVRLATLSSFGKWAVRRGRLPQNPLDLLTRPR